MIKLDKDVKEYTFNFNLVEAMRIDIENLLISLNRYEDVYFYKLNTKGVGEIYFADLKKPSIVIGHHSVIFTPYADYLLAEDMVTFIKIFTKKVYRDYINITYCDDFFKEVN